MRQGIPLYPVVILALACLVTLGAAWSVFSQESARKGIGGRVKMRPQIRTVVLLYVGAAVASASAIPALFRVGDLVALGLGVLGLVLFSAGSVIEKR